MVVADEETELKEPLEVVWYNWEWLVVGLGAIDCWYKVSNIWTTMK